MKILTYIIFILFISCNSDDKCGNITEREVCVTIFNKSGQRIRHLTLTNEKGFNDVGVLKNNSQTSIKYASGGEDSYTIIAVLDNGDTLKSNGTYTEGGWKMNEIVTKDSIKTKYKDSWF
ncbi:MAG: hypothetical protein IPL10_20605 [Bacteroidetes bacterium]|nr:hypothetical protein [Bacteroidota bacterium]